MYYSYDEEPPKIVLVIIQAPVLNCELEAPPESLASGPPGCLRDEGSVAKKRRGIFAGLHFGFRVWDLLAPGFVGSREGLRKTLGFYPGFRNYSEPKLPGSSCLLLVWLEFPCSTHQPGDFAGVVAHTCDFVAQLRVAPAFRFMLTRYYVRDLYGCCKNGAKGALRALPRVVKP